MEAATKQRLAGPAHARVIGSPIATVMLVRVADVRRANTLATRMTVASTAADPATQAGSSAATIPEVCGGATWHGSRGSDFSFRSAAYFAVLLVVACGRGEVGQPPASDTLSAVAFTSDPGIGTGDEIAVTSRFLWVTDVSGDPFVHLVDRASGKVRQSIGRRGEGPGEYQSAQLVFPLLSSSDQVSVYDPQLRRFTTLIADSSGVVTTVSVQDMRTVVPIPRQVGRVGTGIVGWLPDSAQRWASYDSALKLVAIVGGPLVGPREVEWRIRAQASSNMRICGHPDGSRFAVVYGSAARIEIHAVEGHLITLGQTPDTTDGEFATRDGGGGALRWDRTHYRYSGCAATSALVFALYSGQPEGRPEDVAWAGDQVHVLRWDGTLLHTYYIDTRLTSLTLNPSGSALYGMGRDGSTIYEIELPPELQDASGTPAP